MMLSLCRGVSTVIDTPSLDKLSCPWLVDRRGRIAALGPTAGLAPCGWPKLSPS